MSSGDARKRIGEMLIDAGIVSADHLAEALAEQEARGGRLCHHLIRLGHLRTDDLVGFLRDQFGVAAVNLERYRVPEGVLRLIPPAFARERRIVPLNAFGGTLTIALADPSRAEDLDAVRRLTGLEPEPVVCPEAALEAALARFYPAAPPAAVAPEGGVLDLNGADGNPAPASATGPEAEARGEAWLRRLLLQAVLRRSRELHLEPSAEGLRTRYRVDGALQSGETVPREPGAEVVRRARALAGSPPGLDGASPFEGRFRIHVRSRWLRATLSSLPTLAGGRIVIRIVDEHLLSGELRDLGMSQEVAEGVRRLLGFRRGVVLLNAPPGEGGRTTFANLLARAGESRERNVMTLEGQVRSPIAGVSQTLVGAAAGMDLAAGLQAIAAQEPDVVGVAEVSDRTTIERVFAVGRRCLVVALCAFRDNQEGLQWLRDAGVGATTQGRLLRGMLAQRLLPAICPACREPLAEPVPLLEGVRDRRVEDLEFHRGGGCERCGGTGRAGRAALFELLVVGEEVRGRLLRADPCQAILEEAQRLGMWSLREDGILKASQGRVDVRDVLAATAGGAGRTP